MAGEHCGYCGDGQPLTIRFPLQAESIITPDGHWVGQLERRLAWRRREPMCLHVIGFVCSACLVEIGFWGPILPDEDDDDLGEQEAG